MKVIIVFTALAIGCFLLGLLFRKMANKKQVFNGSTMGIIEDWITENTAYWHHVGCYIDGIYHRGQSVYYNPPHKYEKGDQVPIKYYGQNNNQVVIDDDELRTLDFFVKNAARNLWIISGVFVLFAVVYTFVFE